MIWKLSLLLTKLVTLVLQALHVKLLVLKPGCKLILSVDLVVLTQHCLAQLLATRDQLPQTRDKRRVEPAQAVAFYQAVGTFLSAPPTQPGLDIRA